MALYITLIVCVTVLILVVLVMRTQVVIARRERYELSRQIAKEREATTSILSLSSEIISANNKDDFFLARFIEYALRTLKGCGAAILTADDEGDFYGCAVAGTFPSLKEVTIQVEQQLMAHARKHTEFIKGIKLPFTAENIDSICGHKGYAFFSNESPKWFPERFSKEAPRIVIAPIRRKNMTQGCVIVTSKEDFDSYNLTEDDGVYLVRLAEIASLSLEVIRVFRERQEYEEKLQTAREEGMLQVSTGIIHNIGNAVTVAKLTILELEESIGKSDDRPEALILQEVIPKMKEQLDSGSLNQFLSEDEIGQQYLTIITELLTHIGKKSDESANLIKSLSNKLYHISEIIELQQRFVGELGTENMIQISSVIESSVKIYEETCNKRGVEIVMTQEESLPDVLIDSSMMTQVFMNLIKNSVEAMMNEKTPDKKHKIEIISESLEDDNKKQFVVVRVKDNGPGIPDAELERVFEFGFSTKGRSASRGFGLHSCMETVKKYDGKIEVESEIGKGSTFIVTLPV